MTSINFSAMQFTSQNVFEKSAKKTQEEEKISSAALQAFASQPKGSSLDGLDRTFALMQQEAGSVSNPVLSTNVPASVSTAVVHVISTSSLPGDSKSSIENLRKTASSMHDVKMNRSPYSQRGNLLSFGQGDVVERCLKRQLSVLNDYCKETVGTSLDFTIEQMARFVSNSKQSSEEIDQAASSALLSTSDFSRMPRLTRNAISLNLTFAATQCAEKESK